MELTLATAEQFVNLAVGAGVDRMWEVKTVCARLGEQMTVENTQALYREDTQRLGEAGARARGYQRAVAVQAAVAFGQGQIPLWQLAAGLTKEVKVGELHPRERLRRVAVVVHIVEKMVRHEWRLFEKSGDGLKRCSKKEWDGEANTTGKGEGGGRQGGEAPEVRVRWWDPLRFVSESIGIAYAAVSRFAREAAGLTASDLTDRIKAERVRIRMRQRVKAWMLELYHEEPELRELDGEELSDALWLGVQRKRGRGRWSRSSWAVEYGFATYTRFHKACLGYDGVSPIELERAVLEEILKDVEGMSARSADLEHEAKEGSAEGRETGREGDRMEEEGDTGRADATG